MEIGGFIVAGGVIFLIYVLGEQVGLWKWLLDKI